MKLCVILFTSLLLLAGCASMQEDFVFSNLSGHVIIVTDVTGLPDLATPGVLVAKAHSTSSIDGTSIQIKDHITIRWQEGGISQELTLQRDDLGLPAKLSRGQVQFTYFGNEKWSVKYFKENL